MSNWTHPIHARGIRSPQIGVRGAKLLTNKMIDQYAREGRYGTAAQTTALSKKKKRLSPLKQALRLLGL